MYRVNLKQMHRKRRNVPGEPETDVPETPDVPDVPSQPETDASEIPDGKQN